MAVKYYEELIKELAPPETIENNKVEALEITARSDSSVQITWIGNFLDEDGYIVERSESGGAFTVVDTAEANSRYLYDTVANAINEYKYRIKAYNATTESLYSDEVTYTPSYYTLTMTVEGQGTVLPGTRQYLVGANTVDSLRAFPAEGWEFDIWSGDISLWRKSNPTGITIDADKTIICNFEEIVSQVSTQADSEYRFYPNPVNDMLKIELQNDYSQMAVIQLFDNTGRLIINKKVQGSSHTLEMGDLSPGIYLIKVSNNNKETVIKHITKQ
jgi:hypothetical protein